MLPFQVMKVIYLGVFIDRFSIYGNRTLNSELACFYNGYKH